MAKKKAFQIASDAQTVSSLAALARVHLEVANTDISELNESIRNMARSAADTSLIELAEQRVGLLHKKAPLKAECDRLWDVARKAWKATGLSIDADHQRWKNHLECYGYIAAENADNEIQDKINALDEMIRSIPATTLAGLVVKFEVVRHTMNISDGEPRIDQDWDVLLFNEFSDELCRLAAAATGEAIHVEDAALNGRRADELHAAVNRYLDAEKAINATVGKIEGSPEEAVFQAAIKDIGNGSYIATTAVGALSALRLAQRELDDFANSEMTQALVDGAMAYFDGINETSGRALHDSFEMLQSFPNPQSIEGAGWAAIYDGLTSCINTLCGISNQPRGRGDAGVYLVAIEDFLRQELQRLMSVAAECNDIGRDDGSHAQLVAAIQFLVDEADLSYGDKTTLLALLKKMKARG